MREKAPVQTVLDIPSPSSSRTDESDKQAPSVSTPGKIGVEASSSGCGKRDGRKMTRATKSTKKVNFSSPPKWKTKHFVGGSKIGRGGNGHRSALKPLQPNASTKLLVGCGSPRIPAVGKRQKGSKLKQKVIECTSPLSDKQHTSSKKEAHHVSCDKVPMVPASTSHQDEQTKSDTEVSIDYRMCTQEEPPVEYWQRLAEQRRLALAETLRENEELYAEIKEWKRKAADLESQVKDLEYFAMMYKLAVTENP